jgi:hypothetical protein
MPDRIFGLSIDASIAAQSCLLSHRILEILTSIGAPVSWYCGRFTSIDGQCFAKSSATSQFDDQSDPAIKKAKATITAKMGNPASVEFVEIKRAPGANALGNSSDIVCGFVREKNGGPRPFLYLVPKDEAYIGGYNIATSAYRHICSITL